MTWRLFLYTFSDAIDDSFDQRIASELDALDNLQIEQSANTTPSCDVFSAKSIPDERANADLPSDSVSIDSFVPFDSQVSCEDLLDLNGDKENERKVVNKDKGTHSDEVRIMEKVLGPKVEFFLSSIWKRLALA